MSHRLDPLTPEDIVVRRPPQPPPGRPDRDWWAPVVDRKLVVLISDEQGHGSAQVRQVHRVVVCGSEESALRYGRWWSAGDLSRTVDAISWPRYFDELEFIEDRVITWLQAEFEPPS